MAKYGTDINIFKLDDETLDELFKAHKTNDRKTNLNIYIYRILQEREGDGHVYSQKELMDLVEKKYELRVDRKTFSRYLYTLANDGLGVVCTSEGAFYSHKFLWDAENIEQGIDEFALDEAA